MNGAFGFCDSQILCLWTGLQAWKGDLEEHGQTLASNHLTGRWNQYGRNLKLGVLLSGHKEAQVFNWGIRLGHISSEANNSCLKFRQSLLKEPLHEITLSFGSWRKA